MALMKKFINTYRFRKNTTFRLQFIPDFFTKKITLHHQLYQVPTEQNEYIALWQITTEKSQADKNVFLTHGTFSNRKVILRIAEYLADNGYQSWIMEWRNHGESSPSKAKLNFEIIGKRDFPIVFDYLENTWGIQKYDCVTHSGGGISWSIFLINHPQYLSKFNRAVFFGCQAFGAADNFKNYAQIFIGKYVTALLGYSPAKWVGSPHNEPYFFMKQWNDWNLQGKFLGENGIDYEKEMDKIDIPILSICGGGDKLIAPKVGCKKFLDAFQNPKNKFLYCAKSTGFREDYNHSRVLQSRNSRAEIWDIALDWLSAPN